MAHRRLWMIVILVLSALPMTAAQAQTPVTPPPPQITLALDSLSNLAGRPLTLTDLDSWRFEQNLYTNTALGCPYAVGTERADGISGYTFNLVYQATPYDYRVAADSSILFRCDPSLQQAQPVPTSAASTCPADFAGYLPPRLQVGGQGRIGTEGTANRLRAQPSVNADQISVINPGTTVAILEGPSCEPASQIIWWRVSDNGVVGWTAEGVLPDNYFLAPVGTAIPAERNLITTANLDSLVPLATIPLQGVRAISFSGDGTLVAFGGLRGLSVYTMSPLAINTRFSDPTAPVTAVAFSSDGRYLAYSTTTHQLLVLDTLIGAAVTLTRPPNDEINDLAFSSDNRYLLASGSGDILGDPNVNPAWEVYDLPSNRQLLQLPADSWVRNVDFSLDGDLFAWLDLSLHIIRVDGGDNVMMVALGAPPLGGLAWRPTLLGATPTHQVAFSDGELVRLVNIETRTEQTYSGDPGFFPGEIAFSPDGSLLAAINLPADGSISPSTVNIFDTTTSDLITSTLLNPSQAMVFSPDGTLIVIASDGEVIFLGIDVSQLAVG